MNIERNIFLLIAAAVVATAVMINFHNFFKWENGDNFMIYFKRACQEHYKDMQARRLMFGTRPLTIFAHLVNTIFIFGMIISLTSYEYEFARFLILVHLVFGFFASANTAKSARPAAYDRLFIANKMWYRLYYAITWMYYVIERTSKK